MWLLRDLLWRDADGATGFRLPWSRGGANPGEGLRLGALDPRTRETASIRAVFLLALLYIQISAIAGLRWQGMGLVTGVVSILCMLGCAAWVAGWVLRWRHSPYLVLIGLLVAGTGGSLLSGLLTKDVAAAPAFAAAAAAVLSSRWSSGRSALVVGWFELVLLVAAATQGWQQFESNGLGYGSLLAGMYGLGVGRRSYILRAESAEQLVRETERANHEQAHAAALAERSRIAREIHDVLAHSLAALTVQLEAADALLDSGNEAATERAHAYVQKSRRIAREGLVETRRAIAALREDAPPLPELLNALADAYRGDTDAEAKVEIQGLPRPMQADAALTVYRAAQESLTNIRKHAPGAPVHLTLAFGDEEVVLTVANGAPTEPPSALAESGGGYGLSGLKERAELIGGSLEAGPYGSGEFSGRGASGEFAGRPSVSAFGELPGAASTSGKAPGAPSTSGDSAGAPSASEELSGAPYTSGESAGPPYTSGELPTPSGPEEPLGPLSTSGELPTPSGPEEPLGPLSTSGELPGPGWRVILRLNG